MCKNHIQEFISNSFDSFQDTNVNNLTSATQTLSAIKRPITTKANASDTPAQTMPIGNSPSPVILLAGPEFRTAQVKSRSCPAD